MFALGIRYLNGWVMAAADGARKERAEWPPHPDRVFMAMAAAWFETGQDEAEGRALEWMESLPPPEMKASDAFPRAHVVHFVPVNDRSSPLSKKGAPIAESGSFPLGRSRQGRSFPVEVPSEDTVFLIWPDADPTGHAPALSSLCDKVVSIGHSASLAQMWVEPSPPQANWVPVEGLAERRLRVPGPGRLRYLEARCNRTLVLEYADLESRIARAKGAEKRVLAAERERRFGDRVPVSLRPEPGRWQGYGGRVQAESRVAGSVFDPRMVVLAVHGRPLGLRATLVLTDTVRDALMASCPVQPPPEWLSGHGSDGQRSGRPHLAVVPLPFVAAEHADGRIMGVALVLPRGLDPVEAGRCLALHDEHGLPRVLRLFAGRWLECEARIETREVPPRSLRAETWTSASRVWASVTPVVLDRHCDGPDWLEHATRVVADACERIGLARPVETVVGPVSMCEGVPHAREFARLVRKRDGGRMRHVHALLVFGEVVQGPVIVGAGRYRGYGLCRPLGFVGGTDA